MDKICAQEIQSKMVLMSTTDPRVEEVGTTSDQKDQSEMVVTSTTAKQEEKIGKTCHQCRQKIKKLSAHCTNTRKGKPCPNRFCHKCLMNRYGELGEEKSVLEEWICPKCRGICNCSVCMKRRGQKPTGKLFHTAKASGFASVSELLHGEGTIINEPSDELLCKPETEKKKKRKLVELKLEGNKADIQMDKQTFRESLKKLEADGLVPKGDLPNLFEVVREKERGMITAMLREEGMNRANASALSAHVNALRMVGLPLSDSRWTRFVFPYLGSPPSRGEVEGALAALPPLLGTEVPSQYQRGESSSSTALRRKSQKLASLRREREKLIYSLRISGKELVDLQCRHAREKEELKLKNEALQDALLLSPAFQSARAPVLSSSSGSARSAGVDTSGTVVDRYRKICNKLKSENAGLQARVESLEVDNANLVVRVDRILERTGLVEEPQWDPLSDAAIMAEGPVRRPRLLSSPSSCVIHVPRPPTESIHLKGLVERLSKEKENLWVEVRNRDLRIAELEEREAPQGTLHTEGQEPPVHFLLRNSRQVTKLRGELVSLEVNYDRVRRQLDEALGSIEVFRAYFEDFSEVRSLEHQIRDAERRGDLDGVADLRARKGIAKERLSLSKRNVVRCFDPAEPL